MNRGRLFDQDQESHAFENVTAGTDTDTDEDELALQNGFFQMSSHKQSHQNKSSKVRQFLVHPMKSSHKLQNNQNQDLNSAGN